MKIYSFPQKIDIKIKALAIYQIAGGVYGLYLTLELLSGLSQIPTFFIFLFFTAFSLYCYSIICGVLIFAKKDRHHRYSLINQYLQLISFTLLSYGFEYASGIYLDVGINFTDEIIFKFKTGLPSWQIMYNTNNNSMEVYLNLAALFVIIFINKIKRKSNEAIVDNTLEQFSN